MRLRPARLTETIAPKRLGPSFRWLLAATIVNNAGDGVVISAGPLLVAAQTRDPFLVSMALLSEYLFGITAPFWFAFAGSALLVVILWREFEQIVHAGDLASG